MKNINTNNVFKRAYGHILRNKKVSKYGFVLSAGLFGMGESPYDRVSVEILMNGIEQQNCKIFVFPSSRLKCFSFYVNLAL